MYATQLGPHTRVVSEAYCCATVGVVISIRVEFLVMGTGMDSGTTHVCEPPVASSAVVAFVPKHLPFVMAQVNGPAFSVTSEHPDGADRVDGT